MRKLLALMLLVPTLVYGQCPSGDYSGNVTISSNCTISTSLTITGNLIISNSSTLTINPGVVLTVTGSLESAYQSGTITVNGGGIINVGDRFFNDVWTSTSFTFSNVTVSVNNTLSTTSINNYTSVLSLLNGTSFTVVQGVFENDNQTNLTINNSSLIVTSGNFINDYQANLQVVNGGEITLTNGNFITEDQSVLNVNDSDIYINGNINNDYGATLTVANNSSFVVTGNFINGYNSTGDLVNQGHLTVNSSTMSVGGNFSNGYGSDVTVAGGGSLDVTGNVTNDNTATINVTDGSFSYGGTLTGNTGGVTSSGGDECNDGCCGAGCGSLPVELVYFKAEENNRVITISWGTASEINNDYFVINRSVNGVDFEKIGQIEGGGSSSSVLKYNFTDPIEVDNSYYYQLKQYDFDGTETVFPIIRLVYATGDLDNHKIEVYPMPLGNRQNLTIIRQLNGSEIITASISDISGKKSNSLYLETNGNSMKLYTDQLNLTSGLYLIDLKIDQSRTLLKILVN